MTMHRRATTVALLLPLLTACGESEPDAQDGPPTPESVVACLEDRGISAVESSHESQLGAEAELVVGRSGGRAVQVLFYPDEGDAAAAEGILRITGDPSVRLGRAIMIAAGPGFEDVEEAVRACVA